MQAEQRKKAPVSPYAVFLIFNAVFFMMDTTNSYFNIYLDQLGFSGNIFEAVTLFFALALAELNRFIALRGCVDVEDVAQEVEAWLAEATAWNGQERPYTPPEG